MLISRDVVQLLSFSLDKAPKETLRTLLEEIEELSDFAGEVGKQLLNEAENEEIRQQMRIVGSGRGPG